MHLDVYLASGLEGKLPRMILLYQGKCRCRHVNSVGLAVAFHPTGRVDRISKPVTKYYVFPWNLEMKKKPLLTCIKLR